MPLLVRPGRLYHPAIDEAEDATQRDETSPASKGPEPGQQTVMGQANSQEDSQGYLPSALDVVIVKTMLQKALKLPLELVNTIVDFAEYWPHTRTSVVEPDSLRSGDFTENRFLLRTPPLGFIKPVHSDMTKYTTDPVLPFELSGEHPVERFHKWIGSPVDAVLHPCRKIIFTIVSHDQGWGGNFADRGTYKDSWTWFDAGLERIDAQCGDENPGNQDTGRAPRPQFSSSALRCITPGVTNDNGTMHTRTQLLPPPDKIQCNKVATMEETEHRVEWKWTDNIDPESPEAGELEKLGRGRASGTGIFVRSLKLGDVVTVWARQRFPGWANHVRRVQVDVFWAV